MKVLTSAEKESLILEKTKKDPMAWMMNYTYVGDKPFSYRNWYFQKEIAQNLSKIVVVKKSAQMGVSEIFLKFAIWFCEHRSEGVLYTLPTDKTAERFSKDKFTKIILSSPHIQQILSKEDKKTDSLSMKRINGNAMHMIGMSGARSNLESVTVGLIMLDEYSKIEDMSRIPLIEKRLKASKYKLKRYFSTPLYPDDAIDRAYKAGNQKLWHINCEKCGHNQSPNFFSHHNKFHSRKEIEEMDPHYVCENCFARLNVLADGKWIAQNQEGKYDSYSINTTYKPTIMYDEITGEEIITDSSEEIWEAYKEAVLMNERGDSGFITEFYRQELGEGYISDNDRIEISEIDECKRVEGTYSTNDMILENEKIYAMGVDVGRVLHYILIDITDIKMYKIVDVGTFAGNDKFDKLESYLRWAEPNTTIIDVEPELTEARRICDNNRRLKIKLAKAIGGLDIIAVDKKDSKDSDSFIVNYNRTMAFDTTFSRIKQTKMSIPVDVDDDFVKHFLSIIRIEVDGKYKYTGRTGAKVPDHFVSATVFAIIAATLYKKRESVSGKIILPDMGEINKMLNNIDSNTFKEEAPSASQKILQMGL